MKSIWIDPDSVALRCARHEAFWREVSRPYGAHQALWELLSRSSEQRRDFLFRAEDAPGRVSFLVLSAREPVAPADGLWRVESKAFAPALRAGQRLGFKLRASPVVSRGEAVEGKPNRRVHRHDVVMDKARALQAAGLRVPDGPELVHDAGLAWLAGQGARAGFHLVPAEVDAIGDDGLLESEREEKWALRVDGYRQHRIARRGETPIRFSSLDFEGVLAGGVGVP